MASFKAAVAFSMLNIAVSVLYQVDPAGSFCSETVKRRFNSNCSLLKSNPGHIQDVMGTIRFRTQDGKFCVSERRVETFATLAVKEAWEKEPLCCNAEERARITEKREDDDPAERAEAVFGSMATGTLAGFTYWEVIPDHCSTGTACPLVVEISGNGGHPWAMGLSLCKVCKAQMNVVMMAPELGAEEDTTKPYVRSIVALASAYLEKASNIDPERVYLASVSRGNEIGIQAAIFGAHIFKAVIMTGKFKIPGTLDTTWRRDRHKESTQRPKLARVILHIGDEDDVLTDGEFYPKLKDLTTLMGQASHPPAILLNIYQGAGHDITWTTWNEMHSILWTAEQSASSAAFFELP